MRGRIVIISESPHDEVKKIQKTQKPTKTHNSAFPSQYSAYLLFQKMKFTKTQQVTSNAIKLYRKTTELLQGNSSVEATFDRSRR